MIAALLALGACGFSDTYYRGELAMQLDLSNGESFAWDLTTSDAKDTALVEANFAFPCEGDENAQILTYDIHTWESGERLARLDGSRRDPQIIVLACTEQLRLDVRTHSPQYGVPTDIGQDELAFHAEFAEDPEGTALSLFAGPDSTGFVEHADALQGHLELDGLILGDAAELRPSARFEADWRFEPSPSDHAPTLGI